MRRGSLVVGKSRFRVNTKEGTDKFGHVGTLVWVHHRPEGTVLALEFTTLRDGNVRQNFLIHEVQQVYKPRPRKDD